MTEIAFFVSGVGILPCRTSAHASCLVIEEGSSLANSAFVLGAFGAIRVAAGSTDTLIL